MTKPATKAMKLKTKANLKLLSSVEFHTTKKDHELLILVADRAETVCRKDGITYKRQDIEMDLTACHSNGNRLDFGKLLSFDDANFGHDVYGIRRFIDRSTGKLGGFFRPRCSWRKAEKA